ncbi:hypothetical protein Pan4_27 [Pseudanabaena phage Pan4]|nr:hypothetical protein Pan4_27 [Pseudanabaena phage Pan4]
MTITHWTADDLIIAVNVTFEAGSEITSLVGGSVEARAQAAGGAVIPASSVSIIDLDTVRVAFNDGVLAAGVYTLQVRATVTGVTQAIAEEIIEVRASL